jgi:integrase
VKGKTVATIGEWIESARKVSAANESTFTSYSRALRQIASGIIALKKDKKRFGPKKGGSTKYRAAVDSVSLEAFTPTAVQMWRLAYVKKKAKNPAKERAAMTSCNSIIRQARSLFAPKVVKFLDGLILPTPVPFADVEFYERQSAKYISRIDVKAILQKAQTELANVKKPTFLALLLSVGAGLRRGEMDSLQWHQVDTAKKVIRIEVTDVAKLKTEDSRGEVEIDDNLAAILQGHKAQAKGKGYVIVSKALARKSESNPGATPWGQKYRADDVFNDLIAWLRLQGVEARKPIHEMRKELGALITQEHGIYAASRALRHSNVATTAAHYADKKARTTVDIGGMLNPPNVITLPVAESETEKNRKRKKA